MGLLTKGRAPKAPSALGDDFARIDDIRILEQFQTELEKKLTEQLSITDRSMFKGRLEYVNGWIWEVKHGAVGTEHSSPWEWPGPIAAPGMKAVVLKDGTYNHVTTTDPKFKEEESDKGDMGKLLDWAQRCGLGRSEAFALLGSVQPTSHGLGPGLMNQRFSKRVLMELQTKIAEVAKRKATTETTQQEKPKGMSLFKRKEEAPPAPPVQQLISPVDARAKVLDEVAELELANAKERLQLDRDKPINIHSREEADNIMRERTMAIAELKIITENYLAAKLQLAQTIKDIDLVFNEALEKFFKANKPTKNKNWVLTYGELKQRNRPLTTSLDNDNDPDESRFQAWLKTTLEKDAALAERLAIRPLVSYARDMKAVSNYIKERIEKEGKAPAIPGIKVTEAKEDVFSIAPSFNTIENNIREEMKEKGLK